MNLKSFLIVFVVFGYDFVSGRDIPTQAPDQSRVVGGNKATQPYPYQVSLQRPSITSPDGTIIYSWQHSCGGSIITKRHILTAAHCVVNDDGTLVQKEQMSILVGTQHLDSDGTRYYPSKNVTHPKYFTENGGHDIAIITVKGLITFVPRKIEPIKYSKHHTRGDVACVLTGWGSTREYGKGPYPNDLQEIYLSTLSHKDCKAKNPFTTANNICTLSPEGEGICDGDSGGPLVDINEHILVGIAESVDGQGCAVGRPDIFTRVSAFYDWIQYHTKLNGRPDLPTSVKIPAIKPTPEYIN